jgi:hypothetical protein
VSKIETLNYETPKRKQLAMKIKVLGIPILEITQDPFKYKPRPDEPAPDDPLCQPVKDLVLPVTEGYRAASHKRKKDLDAIIQQYDINIEKLQRTTYPNGSLGQMVKSALNSRRALTKEETQAAAIAEVASAPQPLPNIMTEPEPPERIEYTLDALHIMTAQELLHHCNRQHKIDINPALSKFQVSEADILGSDFAIGTAGYRLREPLRMRLHRQPKKEEPIPKANTDTLKKALCTIQTPDAEALKKLCNIPNAQLPRLANGRLDMLASLKLLNITDPRILWKIKAPYGSAVHLLKQVVGCTVGSGGTIDFGNGITNVEVKEIL